jgi:phage FluMu protein Com
MNTKIEPKCPKCGHTSFVTYRDQYVTGDYDYNVNLLLCSKCHIVLGTLPLNEHTEVINKQVK